MARAFNEAGIPRPAVTSRTVARRPTGRARSAARPRRQRRCSPSTCSTRASTSPRSTRCCSSGRPRAPPSSSSSSAAACAWPRTRLPDGARLHRQPARRVPLRPALPGAHRGQSPGTAARDRARLPDAARRLPHRTRPGAAELVLDNVRSSLRIDWRGLVARTAPLGDCHPRRRSSTRPASSSRTSTGAAEAAGRGCAAGRARRPPPGPDDDRLGGRYRPHAAPRRSRTARLLRRVLGAAAAATGADSPRLGRAGCSPCCTSRLWGCRPSPLDEIARRLPASVGQRRTPAGAHSRSSTFCRIASTGSPARSTPGPGVPLHVHARYSRDEAARRLRRRESWSRVRQGVKWVEEEQADVFFVTLRKTEKHYSPTTMYAGPRDHPDAVPVGVAEHHVDASPTGQRYIHHRERGSSVHLFVRETKEADGDLGAPPYLYAGPTTLRQPHRRTPDADPLEARPRAPRRRLPRRPRRRRITVGHPVFIPMPGASGCGPACRE